MVSSRIVSFFLFFVTFGAFTSFATPTFNTGLIARADPADVLSVLNTLKGSTDTILPQIDSVATSGNATDETVTPLITDLTTALNTATTSLASLAVTPVSRKRQASDDEVASLVATLLTDVAKTLDGLVGSAATIPALGGLLAGVDTSLNEVLKGLEILLAGVLKLVANLLVDVAGLLRSLAFGLTLASLGL